MLVNMKQKDENSDLTDHTVQILLLMKAAVDTLTFQVFCQKWRSSFLGLCSMSIVLFDWMIMGLLLTTWLVQDDWSFESPCFPFAFLSMTCRALALPMIFFGLLDHWFNDFGIENKISSSRFQKNVTLALLVWLIALFHSLRTWRSMMIKVQFEPGTVFFVCEEEDLMLMAYTFWWLFSVALLTILFFWFKIPQGLRKINETLNRKRKQTRQVTDNSKENTLDDSNATQPPLWYTLTLDFAIVCISCLNLLVAYMLLGKNTPAFIIMNLHLVECISDALANVVFWIKHNICGSQNQPPENVFSWQIYWHLSRGTNQQQPVEVLVVNPTSEKNVDLLYV
ncbi:uncharacterized protein LOC114467599 [Gouania willdenowi]|uniref:uncharacterized protein LOC114467599 n=1 Tax=Gouania willdenowi TaxID=441366 RepID=UPI0010558B7F|nr:uncharacterized protein LOC114467599 [Gouania willdenowi]